MTLIIAIIAATLVLCILRMVRNHSERNNMAKFEAFIDLID